VTASARRIGLGVSDQLGDGFHRQGRIYHQHVGLHRNQGDRCEILQRIVADGAVEADVHGHRRAGHRQRVAVGPGLGHGLEADVAAGAGTILDDDGLAEVFSQLLPHDAGHDVDAAARREGHHQLDRFGGIVLSLHCRTEQEKETCADRAQSFPHSPTPTRSQCSLWMLEGAFFHIKSYLMHVINAVSAYKRSLRHSP
jgi:hypothetical protein